MTTDRRWRDRAPWIAAGASVLLAIVVNVWMASAATIPLIWTDEVGYLANAQVLSGVGEPRDLAGRSYYVGWSMLLAPLWWVTGDLEALYRAAVAISCLFGIALIVPAAYVARRLGVSWPTAIVAASAVAMAPSHAAMSGFALAENLLTFLIVVTLLCALRYHESPTVGRAVVLGLAAAGVFVTHGRAIPVAIGVGLWLLWGLRRRPAASLAGLAALGLTSGAGFLLYRWTVSFMYDPGADREASAIERIFGSPPEAVLTSATGQVWYQFAAWGGVTVLGGIVLIRAVVDEIRRRQPGPAMAGLVILLGALVVSATWVSRVLAAGRDRIDIYAYGRYLEPYGLVLALLGIVLIARTLSRRAAAVALAVGAVLSLVFFVFVAPQAPLDGSRFWGATSVPGLLQWPWPNISSAQDPPWLWAGAAALLALLAVLLLRRRPSIVIGVMVVSLAASSVLAKERGLDPYFAGFRASFALREELAEYPEASVGFDTADLAGDTVSRNAYQYWGAPRAVVVFDSAAGIPDVDLVVAREDWPVGVSSGARPLADDSGLFDNRLWVLPGPLFDDLVARGLISP